VTMLERATDLIDLIHPGLLTDRGVVLNGNDSHLRTMRPGQRRDWRGGKGSHDI
jgi:hypothetical protein